MVGKLQWRPIAECPPHLARAVVFDPEQTWLSRHDGSVVDERVATASRHDDGRWYVADREGGEFYEPTHFLDAGVPKGCPLIVDPEPLRVREAAREESLRAERARAAEAHAARERGIIKAQEAFWADPEKRLQALSGDQ